MCRRAYHPEVLGLEDRSLLSSVAGPSAHPIVFTRRQFNFVPEQIQSGFYSFRQGGGIAELHDEINEAIVTIPHGRQQGLATSINRILNKLQHDMRAKVPQAVSIAHNEVLAVTRAAMQAQAQAGNVIVH